MGQSVVISVIRKRVNSYSNGDMKKRPLLWLALLPLLGMWILWVTAPGYWITKDKFDMIQGGMTLQDLEALLGTSHPKFVKPPNVEFTLKTVVYLSEEEGEVDAIWTAGKLAIRVLFDSNGRSCLKYL